MAAGLVQGAADEVDLELFYLVVKVDAAGDVDLRRRAFGTFYHLERERRIADLGTEAFDRDLVRRRNHNSTLDDVLQLSNISGEVIVFEQ